MAQIAQIIKYEGDNSKEIFASFLSSKAVIKYAEKAKALFPRCNSWNTNVENGIFYCEDCGFEA